MVKVVKFLVFLGFFLIGLYLVNYSLNLIEIPEFLTPIEFGINVIGGILVIMVGFYFLLKKSRKRDIL